MENEEGARDPGRRKFVKYGIAAAGAVVLGLVGYSLLGKQLISGPTITSTTENIITTTTACTLWEDDRISIMLDKIERTDTIPPAERLLPGATPPVCQPPPLSKGCDYVILYFAVSRIERVHITELMCEGSALVDDKGGKGKLICVGFYPVILRDGLSTRTFYPGETDFEFVYELAVGGRGFVVYELATQAKPATFELVYSYLESWEQKNKEYGRIVMQLCL